MEVLLFSLSDEKFCIPLTFVEAVEHTSQITYVPKAKKYIAGLVNIRGNIIPAVDMAKLMNLDKKITLNKFILINDQKQSIAIMADDVDDVIDVGEGDIEKITLEDRRISIIKLKDMVATLITQDELNKI